jgi:hypothetical protein
VLCRVCYKQQKTPAQQMQEDDAQQATSPTSTPS